MTLSHDAKTLLPAMTDDLCGDVDAATEVVMVMLARLGKPAKKGDAGQNLAAAIARYVYDSGEPSDRRWLFPGLYADEDEAGEDVPLAHYAGRLKSALRGARNEGAARITGTESTVAEVIPNDAVHQTWVGVLKVGGEVVRTMTPVCDTKEEAQRRLDAAVAEGAATGQTEGK